MKFSFFWGGTLFSWQETERRGRASRTGVGQGTGMKKMASRLAEEKGRKPAGSGRIFAALLGHFSSGACHVPAATRIEGGIKKECRNGAPKVRERTKIFPGGSMESVFKTMVRLLFQE